MLRPYFDTGPEVMMGRHPMNEFAFSHSTVGSLASVSVAVTNPKSKEPLSDDHTWNHGIILGICPSTGQYILHCVERKMIKFARTIKCLPDESKWSSTDIEDVRSSPYDNHKSTDPGVVLQDRPARPGDADQSRKAPTGRKK